MASGSLHINYNTGASVGLRTHFLEVFKGKSKHDQT